MLSILNIVFATTLRVFYFSISGVFTSYSLYAFQPALRVVITVYVEILEPDLEFHYNNTYTDLSGRYILSSLVE